MNNKIIFFGLGNFGDIYKNTRHNVGVNFIESWMLDLNIEWNERQNYFFSSIKIKEIELLFVKFKDFINLSGENLKKILKDLNEDYWITLICSDNIDLQFGKMKFYDHLPKNGHNGLNNLRKAFSNFNFTNLQIGIDKKKPVEKWVLSNFSNIELNILKIKFKEIQKFLLENLCSIIKKKQIKWTNELKQNWGQYKTDNKLV